MSDCPRAGKSEALCPRKHDSWRVLFVVATYPAQIRPATSHGCDLILHQSAELSRHAMRPLLRRLIGMADRVSSEFACSFGRRRFRRREFVMHYHSRAGFGRRPINGLYLNIVLT